MKILNCIWIFIAICAAMPQTEISIVKESEVETVQEVQEQARE